MATLDNDYWDERYRQGATTWDIGKISSPLKAYFEQLTDKGVPILIPGCGNGYEAGWLLENGFSDLTLIDISEELTGRLKEKFSAYTTQPPALSAYTSPPLTIITGDFFQLQGEYGLIIEQTFFCALDPSLRPLYVEKMHGLLKPGGNLAGLLFDREFASGPPFGGHRDEYAELLSAKFTIHCLEPCYNSIPPRAGTELFFIAGKRTDL